MKSFKILFLAVIILAGCNSQLDIEPFNQVSSSQALRTSGDVEALLVGAYTAAGDGDVLGGNMQRDAELLGDDGEIFWDGTFVAPGEIWAKDMLINNDQARETWLDTYETINTANTVLANIALVTADKKNRVEGEAKFLRGLLYFELARIYGRTWLDGNPTQNLAVPLALSVNSTEKLARSTVAQVYGQAITDLTEAKTLLPARNGLFATRQAASAVLSRIYLMQGDYANALAESNTVIGSDEHSLTAAFADAFGRTSTQSTSRTSNGNATTEDVFAIQVTSQAGVNNLHTFFDPASRGDIPVEDAHLTIYTSGDVRRSFFVTSGGVRYTRKFNNRFGNVSVVRLAEMYLTRAEANFRLSSSVGATPEADINRIRNRAGLANITPGSLTLDEILNERRRELAFEGHLIHDLKRTLRPVGSLSYNDPKLVFPIPQRETIINPGLTQNPGY